MVIEEGGGEEAACGGDEGWGGTFSFPGSDESVFKDTSRRGNFDGRVGMDVDVEKARVVGEESLP